jgi:hypothetical protein
MPSVVDSIGSLISSILGAITSIFSGIIGLFQNALSAIIGIFTTLLSAVGTSISGLAQTFEGLLKFLLSESPQSLTKSPSFSSFRFLFEKQWDEMRSGLGVKMNVGDFADNVAIGNILVIGLVLAALFLYSLYSQRAPVSAKKTA